MIPIIASLDTVYIPFNDAFNECNSKRKYWH